MQYLECAYASVLEEYTGARKAGHIMHILHILHILNFYIDHCLGGAVSICNRLQAL